MHCRIGHNGSNGMAVARFYRRMGLLAAANTFHPVAHMVGGELIAPGIGGSNDRLVSDRLISGSRFGCIFMASACDLIRPPFGILYS